MHSYAQNVVILQQKIKIHFNDHNMKKILQMSLK